MGHISLLFYRATQDRQWGWWVFITPNPVVFHVMAFKFPLLVCLRRQSKYHQFWGS